MHELQNCQSLSLENFNKTGMRGSQIKKTDCDVMQIWGNNVLGQL